MNPILGVFLFVSVAIPVLAQPRQWRSLNGHSFEGELLSVQADTVTLKGVDGRVVTLPLAALDEASRQQAQTAATPPGEPAKNILHQHETPSYRITLLKTSNTLAHLELRERGKPVNFPPLPINIHHHEIDGKTYIYRGIREATLLPVKEKNTIVVRYTMANEVVVEVTYEFKADGVDLRYRMEDPPVSLPPLALRMEMSFPGLLEYDIGTKLYKGFASPTGTSFEDLGKLLSGYKIQHRPVDGKTENISFTEPRKGGLYGSEWIAISGPFSKAKLQALGPQKGLPGSTNIWFYEGKSPYDGFSIGFLYPELPIGPEAPSTFGIRFN
jgi:hypothetical protein